MSAIFDTRYYSVTKLFASLVGLWPYQSQLRRRAIQSLSIFIMSTWIPCELKRLYHVWGRDVDAVCMSILLIVTILASMAKLVTSALFASEHLRSRIFLVRQVRILLRQIESNWKVNPSCILAILCNGLICFITIPMISPVLDIILSYNETRVKSSTHELDYKINFQINWLWFWLHSSTTSSAIILNIIGADLIYVTLTIHVCCMFVIVRYKLEHIGDPNKEYTIQFFENHNHNIEYYVYPYEDRQLKLKEKVTAVRDCVINHQKAIEYVQLLHCIYTWYFLVILGLNLTLISISAVQLIGRLLEWEKLMMSLIFIIGQITHLFLLSLMAQYVLNQSSNVHKSIYLCYWYNMPVKIQKDIILIIIRSCTPCKMVAGKLYVMSLENFCSIMQMAVSYFTVLASFR